MTIETVFPFDVSVKFVSTKVCPCEAHWKSLGEIINRKEQNRFMSCLTDLSLSVTVRAPGEGLRRHPFPVDDGPLKCLALGPHHHVQ